MSRYVGNMWNYIEKYRMKKIVVRCIVLTMLFVIIVAYAYRFYPQQQMPVGEPISIKTPEPEKYHDDCLHPCVRELCDGSFAMVHTPYYAWNNKIENPMIYHSSSLTDFGMGTLLVNTPEIGFNSDPNVFVDDTLVYAFYRAFETPQCKELCLDKIVLGGRIGIMDTVQFVDKQIYIYNKWNRGDLTQCPILMKHEGKYLFYAAWYQYGPERKNRGVAVWEGSSLDEPDFQLTDTIPFDNPLVCDKLFQKKIWGWIYYVPIPKRYDMWHFDLFEYDDKLFMVSCAEKDDNIVLSVSTDWRHFKTCWKPLVNNHCSENYTEYRQYYYKPTAIIQNDSLYLYYTANAKDDPNRNQLFLSKKAMKDLKY